MSTKIFVTIFFTQLDSENFLLSDSVIFLITSLMSIAKEMHEVAAFQFAFFSALNFTQPLQQVILEVNFYSLVLT